MKKIILNTDNNKCSSPSILNGTLLNDAKEALFTCPIEDERCPKKCSCYKRSFDESLIINCTASDPTLPIALPNIKMKFNFTEIHFQNNSLTKLLNLFANKSLLNQIRRLYVFGNKIATIMPEDIPNEIEVCMYKCMKL